MRNLILIGLAAVFTACGSPRPDTGSVSDRAPAEAVSPVVGLEFGPTPPDRFEARLGWLLTHIREAEYAVQLVRDPAGQSPTTFWLDSLIHRVDGRPVWRVLAVVPVPDPGDGEVFVPLTCSYDGVADPNLIALARDNGTQLLTDVRLALRVAVELPAFVPVEPDRVSCVREIP